MTKYIYFFYHLYTRDIKFVKEISSDEKLCNRKPVWRIMHPLPPPTGTYQRWEFIKENKKVRKNERKYALDQESDQESDQDRKKSF